MRNKINKIILAICLVLIGTVSAYAFSFRNMTLDFVQISDTHITTQRDDTSYKALSSSVVLLKDAIDQINHIKGLDFVLFTGDLVDSGTLENYHTYFSVLTKLKYPTLNAFGNHDFTYGEMSREEVLDFVKKCNPNYVFSDTYYSFSPKTDYRIIVLDPVVNTEQTSNGFLPDEQLQFLDRELAENKDKIVVIAMHFPSVEPFSSSEHALTNASSFNEILLKYKNPIVVVSGHYHAAKIRQIGNLVFVSTPSMVTYPMGFRHIKITNFKDRVTFKFDFMPTRLDDIKEANRQNVISYGTLAGFERDRNTSFIYRKKSPKSVRYKRNKIKNATKQATTNKRELKKLTQPQKVKVKKPKKQRKFFKFGKKQKQKQIENATPVEM